jgi:hypothetical protein
MSVFGYDYGCTPSDLADASAKLRFELTDSDTAFSHGVLLSPHFITCGHMALNPVLPAVSLLRTYRAGHGFAVSLSRNSRAFLLSDLDRRLLRQDDSGSHTKAATNVLVRRGKEWHAPDRMVINARHIILIESVRTSSQVAQLIAEDKRKNDDDSRYKDDAGQGSTQIRSRPCQSSTVIYGT